jgi:hypothetical protein
MSEQSVTKKGFEKKDDMEEKLDAAVERITRKFNAGVEAMRNKLRGE